MKKDIYLVIDIGGTKIAFSLFTRTGKFLGQSRMLTATAKNKKTAIRMIHDHVTAFAQSKNVNKTDIKKIAVACPGPFDINRGIIGDLPNLKAWKGLRLKEGLKKTFRVPVFIENDANLAALGEASFGAGKGKKSVLFVTFSTGIGGGYVHNGKLFSGTSGDAFEIGHMTLMEDGPKCGCGKRGCLEAIASGTAMQRNAKILAKKNKKSKLAKLFKAEKKMSVELIMKAVKKGDPNAKAVIDISLTYLAMGLSNLIQIINPDVLVIGGGISNNWKLINSPLNKYLKKYTWPRPLKACKVVRAKLGNDAPFYGGLAKLLNS